MGGVGESSLQNKEVSVAKPADIKRREYFSRFLALETECPEERRKNSKVLKHLSLLDTKPKTGVPKKSKVFNLLKAFNP